MKVWQGCALAVVAFVALIGLIVGVVFYATSGVTDTADEFFAAANEGDYEEAYSLTSQQLQAQTDVAGLEQFLTTNGLNQVVDTSWSSRSIENDRGEVTGTVTTAGGGSIPVSVDLIYEGEEWKIIFIDVNSAGLQSSGGGSANADPAPMILPSASDQEDLLFFASAGFVNALEDGDFSDWHNQFVDSISVEELEQNFGGFQPLEADMRRLIGQGPEWEPATSLNENGHLELAGSYGNTNEELRFRYIFVGEGDSAPKIAFVDYEID
ncbi:hypothetical protein [uncultured Erythrobacter sp.]|uniref:hypothetical protein n=1 Tax=uncultured Erythrobacter sp. TaxID=263913 RepID=UPI00260B8750|nr:hypothetical protein [uncultured Erythrobacter sp.]